MGIWVHPYTVALVSGGVGFQGYWVWLRPIDDVSSWLRLQTTVDCIPHPYICIQSRLEPRYILDGHMSPPFHYNACSVENGLQTKWGMVEPK